MKLLLFIENFFFRPVFSHVNLRIEVSLGPSGFKVVDPLCLNAFICPELYLPFPL